MMNRLVLFITAITVVIAFIEEENDDLDGRLFSGDMMLTAEQWHQVLHGGDIAPLDSHGFAAMKNTTLLWLPNGKIVPFTISSELEKLPEATFGIMQGLREWEERSCLTFKRRSMEKDYIEFIKDSGCWSYVGRQGGMQNVSLDEGCWGKGTVTHEIGHAMGFGHEQNRPDRDEFIKIRWENIPDEKKHNFEKYSNSQVDSLGSPYDYKSFMQYSKRSFGINDSVTLDPIKPDIFQLGQRVGFTQHDQYQAMQLYQCEGKTIREPDIPQTYNVQGDDTCDFENGLCHYTQDSTDDFDWSRRYGGTPSDNTGPETDHSTGRLGVFIYTEASSPRKEGDVARLLSKTFPATQQAQCLSFFYHMFSLNKTMMGSFNVYLDDAAAGRRTVLMHQNGTSKENNWQEKKLTFKPKGRYQIIFESIRGKGYQGDVALDDISFKTGPCIHGVKSDSADDKDENCANTSDREGQYCDAWQKAGFCQLHKKEMRKFCKQSCGICKNPKDSS